MKYLSLVAGLLCACAPIHPVTPAYRVACDPKVPHKGERYACLAYGSEIIPRLQTAGANHVHTIIYRQRSDGGIMNHRVTAYTDTEGTWIVDNEVPWPVHVSGKDDQELINWYMAIRFGMNDTTTAEIIR